MENELSDLAKKIGKEFGLSDENLKNSHNISEFINEKMCDAIKTTTVFDDDEKKTLFKIFSHPPFKIVVPGSTMLQSLSHAYNAFIEMSEIYKGFAKLADKARNDFADQKNEDL